MRTRDIIRRGSGAYDVLYASHSAMWAAWHRSWMANKVVPAAHIVLPNLRPTDSQNVSSVILVARCLVDGAGSYDATKEGELDMDILAMIEAENQGQETPLRDAYSNESIVLGAIGLLADARTLAEDWARPIKSNLPALIYDFGLPASKPELPPNDPNLNYADWSYLSP